MTEKHNKPPALIRWLLKIFLERTVHDSLIGDYDEMYGLSINEKGKSNAWLWYLSQLLRAFPVFIKEISIRRSAMLKNNLKIALRNIFRYKYYSLINLSGLATGLTVFIFIIAFVWNELNHDRFHKNIDNIYQVGLKWHNGTPPPLADLLSDNFPEIEGIVRFRNNYGEKDFRNESRSYYIENCYFVDPQIFKVFSFELIEGDPETALIEPYSIVLTETESGKIFGSEDPLGKTITYKNRFEFTVTGIIKDIPANSSFFFGALLPFESLSNVRGESVNWGHWSSQTYLLFREGDDKEIMEEKIGTFLDGFIKQKNWQFNMLFTLRPFKDLYFDIERGGRFKHGSKQKVSIFILSAFLILFIAVSNFINLSTARASVRAKEVGMRKVMGSFKSQLIRQFLNESFIFCFISVLTAFTMVLLLKEHFYSVLGEEVDLDFITHPYFVITLFSGAGLISIIAGLYPAIYLTSFRPIDVIQGKSSGGVKGGFTRKFLILFQFTITIILITVTSTVNRQLNYINDKDLGFDKEHLVWIEMSDRIKNSYGVLKDRLLENPNVKNVSATDFTKPGIWSKWTRVLEGRRCEFFVFLTDEEYIETMGLTLVNGRDFSGEILTDRGTAVILNEAAVEEFEIKDPIGKSFGEGIIVGVVKNFNYRSLHSRIGPLALIYQQGNGDLLNLRIAPDNINAALTYVQDVWKEISPDSPFEYNFYDESFSSLYRSEINFQRIFLYFSFFAIFIASFGLLGLASFTTSQRIKEIGIRKVLGSSISGLAGFLNKEYIKLILLSNLISLPIGLFLINNWLQNFAYRIEISLLQFAAVGVFTLIISLITVSFITIKAAMSNPVDSLRNE
ncbi:MAG: FtsX-like permease family protein [bacterium]|nr:FtsX-like permease family protein [bacterium]